MDSNYLVLLVLLAINHASSKVQSSPSITTDNDKDSIKECLNNLSDEGIDLNSLLIDVPYWAETHISLSRKCWVYQNTTSCLKSIFDNSLYSKYAVLRGLSDALNLLCYQENREEVVLYQSCYADAAVNGSLNLCSEWKNSTNKLMKKNPTHDANNATCRVDEVYQECISATLESFSVCKNSSSLLQKFWRQNLKFYILNNTNCFSKNKGDEEIANNEEWSIILGVVLAVTIVLFIIGIIMLIFFLYWRKNYNAEDGTEDGSRSVLRILGPRREVPPPYALVVPTQAGEGVDGGPNVVVAATRGVAGSNVGGGERNGEGDGVEDVRHTELTANEGNASVGRRRRRPLTTLRLVDCEDRRVAERLGRFYNGDTTNTTGNGLILPPPYPESDDGWKKKVIVENVLGKDSINVSGGGGELKGKRNYRVFVYNNDNVVNDRGDLNTTENIYVNNVSIISNINTNNTNNNNTNNDNSNIDTNNNDNRIDYSSSNDGFRVDRTESYITIESSESFYSRSGSDDGRSGVDVKSTSSSSGSRENVVVVSSGDSGECSGLSASSSSGGGGLTTDIIETSSSESKLDSCEDICVKSSNSFLTDVSTTPSTTPSSSKITSIQTHNADQTTVVASTTTLEQPIDDPTTNLSLPKRTCFQEKTIPSNPNISFHPSSPHHIAQTIISSTTFPNSDSFPYSSSTSPPKQISPTSYRAFGVTQTPQTALNPSHINSLTFQTTKSENISSIQDIESSNFVQIPNLNESIKEGIGAVDNVVSFDNHSTTPEFSNNSPLPVSNNPPLPASLESHVSLKSAGLPTTPASFYLPVISSEYINYLKTDPISNQESDVCENLLRDVPNPGVEKVNQCNQDKGESSTGDTGKQNNIGKQDDKGEKSCTGRQDRTGTNQSDDRSEVSFKEKKSFFHRLSLGNNNIHNNNTNKNFEKENNNKDEKKMNSVNNNGHSDDKDKSGRGFDEFSVV